jgi:hypothetical protein
VDTNPNEERPQGRSLRERADGAADAVDEEILGGEARLERTEERVFAELSNSVGPFEDAVEAKLHERGGAIDRLKARLRRARPR